MGDEISLGQALCVIQQADRRAINRAFAGKGAGC